MTNNKLPHPKFRGARNDHIINLDDFDSHGTTFIIPAEAELKADYVIIMKVVGDSSTFTHRHTVRASEEGRQLEPFNYTLEQLREHFHRPPIELKYQVVRPDGWSKKSEIKTYSVTGMA
ncbi:hypothetical protein GIW70_02855 [Pseudomonas syringae]|nr:hypothetical protein [Pseudomonas syringae]MCF5067136.1 hypothetical protein [Pseudomonas syringae]